jgi:hypothetical protein
MLGERKMFLLAGVSVLNRLKHPKEKGTYADAL